MQQYPDVRLQVQVSNRRVDVIDEGIDIALRVRSRIDDDPGLRRLVEKKLGRRGHTGRYQDDNHAGWLRDDRDHRCDRAEQRRRAGQVLRPDAALDPRGHHPLPRREDLRRREQVPERALGGPRRLPARPAEGRPADGRPASGHDSATGRPDRPASRQQEIASIPRVSPTAGLPPFLVRAGRPGARRPPGWPCPASPHRPNSAGYWGRPGPCANPRKRNSCANLYHDSLTLLCAPVGRREA